MGKILLYSPAYIIEGTRILGNDVQWTAQSAKGTSIKTVGVSSADNIGSGGVDSGMDHEGSGVDVAVRASVNNLSLVIDQDKIGSLDKREGKTKGIYPEGSRINRITNGDMTGNTLIEAVLAKDAESCSQATLEVYALFEFVVKGRGAKDLHPDSSFVKACLLGVKRTPGRDLASKNFSSRSHCEMIQLRRVDRCSVIADGSVWDDFWNTSGLNGMEHAIYIVSVLKGHTYFSKAGCWRLPLRPLVLLLRSEISYFGGAISPLPLWFSRSFKVLMSEYLDTVGLVAVGEIATAYPKFRICELIF